RRDATMLEVDWIEYQARVRQRDVIENRAANLRARRGAVVVLEPEVRARMTAGETRDVRRDSGPSPGVPCIRGQAAEEEPYPVDAEPACQLDLRFDGFHRPPDVRFAVEEVAPAARHDPDALTVAVKRLAHVSRGGAAFDDVVEVQIEI